MRLERILSVALTGAAVIIALALARREFRADKELVPLRAVGPPTLLEEWRALRSLGRTLGDTSSVVSIIEFFDLECPFCERFHTSVLRPLRRKHGDRISFTLIHFPLESHRFAPIAARASECAAKQGRFEQFIDLAYSYQDSFGLKPWAEIAGAAGVRDQRAFERCLTSRDAFAMIDSGLGAGRRLGVLGTPTVLVNGWRFQRPPDSTELSLAVSEILLGRIPTFSEKR